MLHREAQTFTYDTFQLISAFAPSLSKLFEAKNETFFVSDINYSWIDIFEIFYFSSEKNI